MIRELSRPDELESFLAFMNPFFPVEVKFLLECYPGDLRLTGFYGDRGLTGGAVITGRDNPFFPKGMLLYLLNEVAPLEKALSLWEELRRLIPLRFGMAAAGQEPLFSLLKERGRNGKAVARRFSGSMVSEFFSFPPGVSTLIAEEKDLGAIKEIWLGILMFYEVALTPEILAEWRRLELFVRRGEVFLLCKDGRIAGTGIVHFSYAGPTGAEIEIMVHPSFWGRGYGSFLVRFLNHQCRKSRLKALARCHSYHEAARKTLIRGGMVQQDTVYEFEV